MFSANEHPRYLCSLEGGGGRGTTPVGLHQLSCPNLALSRSHIYIYMHPITQTRRLQQLAIKAFCAAEVVGGLTYVVFMVDDRVEGHIFALQVPLGRLHVVGAVVALDEAVELAIHHRTVSQGTFLTWGSISQGFLWFRKTRHTKKNAFHYCFCY